MQSNSISQGHSGLIDLLLRSGEALRNWRALATLMASGVALIVIFMAFASFGSFALTVIGALLALAIGAIGISATGILLTDQALGMAPRSIDTALLDGLFAALRLLALGLIGLVAVLLVALTVSILLLLCKIPGIGGVLYAVILPVSVLAAAFVYGSLYFIFCLAGPAVWSGASIRQALAALYAVAKNRLFETALGIIFLILLIGLIGFLVGAFISSGAMLVGGLSVSILGGSFDSGSLLGMMPGHGMGYRMDGDGSSGLIYGGIFGVGILMAVVGALLFCMTLLGLIRLYHHLTASLDLANAEAELAQRMEKVKQRAAAVQEEARRRAEELRQRSQSKASSPAPSPAAAPVCPACQAPVGEGDKFCESCGQSLG
ncbi:MAG: zinc ribbon domain-containing protein [Burkholderiaceae bacterium]|jgi:uncharacterized membrane protein|nr:zinc ribbon domain-containing protein [Burkholderiaceae bacterium]